MSQEKKPKRRAVVIQPETDILAGFISALVEEADARFCGGVFVAEGTGEHEGEFFVVRMEDDDDGEEEA